jgi:hypothetical protein
METSFLLNAEPFPDREGKYGRIIFSKWKQGWDGWMFKWYPEDQVQEIFRSAGQRIPDAVLMPSPGALPPEHKPSYPLSTRIRAFFEDLASTYGPGRAFWLPAMFLCGFIVLMVVIFLFIWDGRRGRH